MSARTLEPVTLGGWYEHEDGTVGEYRWRDGSAVISRTVATWADVPDRDALVDEPNRTYERDA